MTSDFRYSIDFKVTPEVQASFERDGYIIVRGLLDKEELGRVEKTLLTNREFTHESVGIEDETGRAARLTLWNQPGTDVTGMLARCEKVAKTAQDLLGGEVYHYHTKLMMKNAKEGGKHIWHQDYGYWYNLNCLRPDMATVFIAIDNCKRENGCLQVLKGTHKCGRIEHIRIGGQQGAEPERLEQIKKHFEHTFVEMNAGDALFFHSNLLHASSQNDSDNRRWAFLVAYNRADNNPYATSICSQYTPLEMVPNDAIKTCTNFTDLSGKDFYEAEKDPNVSITRVGRGEGK